MVIKLIDLQKLNYLDNASPNNPNNGIYKEVMIEINNIDFGIIKREEEFKIIEENEEDEEDDDDTDDNEVVEENQKDKFLDRLKTLSESTDELTDKEARAFALLSSLSL